MRTINFKCDLSMLPIVIVLWTKHLEYLHLFLTHPSVLSSTIVVLFIRLIATSEYSLGMDVQSFYWNNKQYLRVYLAFGIKVYINLMGNLSIFFTIELLIANANVIEAFLAYLFDKHLIAYLAFYRCFSLQDLFNFGFDFMLILIFLNLSFLRHVKNVHAVAIGPSISKSI